MPRAYIGRLGYVPPKQHAAIRTIGEGIHHTCHDCGAAAADDQLTIRKLDDATLLYVHRQPCKEIRR